MGATKIEWCDYSFNGWWGCQRVAPECENCYAEAFSKRLGFDIWGPTKPRRFFGDKHWAEPEKWNRQAQAVGVRRRVFCASMSDVFEDRPELDAHRARLWALIDRTPMLDWLLLTKRPENQEMVPSPWREYGVTNVWLGTSCGAVGSLWRVDEVLRATWARVRFVSAEPLLEQVDLGDRLTRGINWVITGAESGSGNRAMDEGWVRFLRDQCAGAGVPFFYKQKVVGRMKVGLPQLDGRQHAEFPR